MRLLWIIRFTVQVQYWRSNTVYHQALYITTASTGVLQYIVHRVRIHGVCMPGTNVLRSTPVRSSTKLRYPCVLLSKDYNLQTHNPQPTTYLIYNVQLLEYTSLRYNELE